MGTGHGIFLFLFSTADIERAMTFQAILKERFAKDLATLQVRLT